MLYNTRGVRLLQHAPLTLRKKPEGPQTFR